MYHTVRSVPSYAATFRKTRPSMLHFHIAAGAMEIVRYHVSVTFKTPTPNYIDLILCLVQFITTIHLVKTLVRGSQATRPIYQLPSFVRPILSALALYTGNVGLHRSSVKIVNAFIYVRLIIFASKGLKLRRMISFSDIYAYAAFLGGLLGVYESALPGGVPVYIALVGIIISVHTSVTGLVDQEMKKKEITRQPVKLNPLVRLAVFLGLAELRTLQKYNQLHELLVPIEDKYCNNPHTWRDPTMPTPTSRTILEPLE